MDRSSSDSNVLYHDVKKLKDLLFLSENDKRQTDITQQSCASENYRVQVISPRKYSLPYSWVWGFFSLHSCYAFNILLFPVFLSTNETSLN